MKTEEFKYEHGVLMVANRTCHSVIREIAELSMSALGLDAGDFRKRDAVISATNDIFQRALQYQAAQPAVVDALAQSTQSPVEQPPQTVAGDAEYCWLIECQPLWDSKYVPIYYWSGNGNAEGWGNDSGWTTDAYKAVRFARKFDAERVIAFHVPPNRRFAKAVEHAFDPPLTRHEGA